MCKPMPVGSMSNPVSAYHLAARLVPFLVCHWICPRTGVWESTCLWFTLLDLFLQAFPFPTRPKSKLSPACVLAVQQSFQLRTHV